MIDIADPAIDWLALARSMGVDAARAATSREFAERFAEAVARPGPSLIEAVIQ